MTNNETNLVRVAVVEPKALDRVSDLLERAGIVAALHGSRAYAVEVSLDKADRTAELLREDSKLRGYWVSFPVADNPEKG